MPRRSEIPARRAASGSEPSTLRRRQRSSIVESSSRDCDVAADSSPLDLNLALAALASARFPFQHFTGAVLRQTLFCTTTLSYAPAWPVHVALHLATIIIPLQRLSSTPRRATQTLPLPLLSI
ncbi:hypothetical protein D0Y65_038792 [Glycine soja]|uniref:Uncharacterized protein n=1 Tax=Glycine soja TaxID=3848 RepID=A0A445H6G6_GLYSO|nr:hypothetical protein D0Y65_038792 [Glycine soja]